MERVRELMREHRGQLEEPEPEPGRETIVAAALQVEGFTVSLPRPARHDTIFAVIDGHISLERAIVQGFLTSAGRFVTRVEAKHIAHRAGQPTIRDNLHPRDAFSEDFW